VHWSWDKDKKTYFGIVRRGGDGKDVRWIEGPNRSSTHVMGAFEDKGKIYVDVEMSMGNPFPFFPQKDGSPWNPATGTSHITRLSAYVNDRSVKDYGIEQLYPHAGALPRQDDRYNTVPYRYGFLGSRDPEAKDPRAAGSVYVRFDNQTRKYTQYNAGTSTSLAECCFAPKNAKAKEGEGYLMGLANRMDEGGRSDLIILDAEHLEDGPVAVVKLPMRAVGQVHGLWVPEAQMPQV
jgi:carotenoid cleavage dioxygenase